MSFLNTKKRAVNELADNDNATSNFDLRSLSLSLYYKSVSRNEERPDGRAIKLVNVAELIGWASIFEPLWIPRVSPSISSFPSLPFFPVFHKKKTLFAVRSIVPASERDKIRRVSVINGAELAVLIHDRTRIITRRERSERHTHTHTQSQTARIWYTRVGWQKCMHGTPPHLTRGTTSLY